MKIIVLGATGDIGRQVVSKALEKGHTVVALCRGNPDNQGFTKLNSRLTVKQATASQPELISEIAKGADIVISCMGPRNASKPDGLFATSLPAIIRACDRQGVKRFTVLTADFDAASRDPAHPGLWFRNAVVAPMFLSNTHKEMRLMEDWLAGATGMEFCRGKAADAPAAGAPLNNIKVTVVRPYSLAKSKSEEYRVATLSIDGQKGQDGRGIPGTSWAVSRAALASFLALDSYKEQYANKAVLLDTQGVGGCF